MDQLEFKGSDSWDMPPHRGNVVTINTLERPIWTETKAQLIRDYLKLFLFITKHGTYIDGFAGPQYENHLDAWAAKLVLELRPPWLRNFFLCELADESHSKLRSLVDAQPQEKNRKVNIHHGNFNNWVQTILGSGVITDREATFALLDQRTTECEWRTVEALANHKRGSTKIELFYFFPTGWVGRTLAAQKDTAILDGWWGDNTWSQLEGIKSNQASDIMTRRFHELGYLDVKAWPITYMEKGQGRTMYHMIHATDHREAPKLMYRAYKHLVAPPDTFEQIDWVTELLGET
ncbi:MAG: three-Cys-motif partner protein TcmP [Candidatus Thiodiazotropha sp. (ex Lucinoma borealis)]|nr:three-Cys-motif partner protein TcmP [Candidatus Thiodiazotropha sp. (ex Lucinoma borealis)]MCU7865272.1 three-Cys-motif partner protein TcmP [Candidatus Thiodiazotropha sp. (ex Lucinoma borealis)]